MFFYGYRYRKRIDNCRLLLQKFRCKKTVGARHDPQKDGGLPCDQERSERQSNDNADLLGGRAMKFIYFDSDGVPSEVRHVADEVCLIEHYGRHCLPKGLHANFRFRTAFCSKLA